MKKPFWILLKKELSGYLKSPMVYVVTAVFLALCGLLYFNLLKLFSIQSLKLMALQRQAPEINLHDIIFRSTFHNMTVILLMVLPVLTMGIFSDEKRFNTMELLLTSPVAIRDIVISKFFAIVSVYAVMLILTLPMPLMMNLLKPMDWTSQIAGYTGIFFTGILFISIGMFTSSVTKNQLISSLLCFGILIILWVLGFFAMGFEENKVMSYISIFSHNENFHKGIISTADISYFISISSFSLFLTYLSIHSHRWRQ